AISGSAVVKIIETHLEQPEELLKAMSHFIQTMKAATKNSQ
ncbi:tryptophan synthase subunit alpha, partial [Photobacterium damselae]